MPDAPWWIESAATGIGIVVGAAMIKWQQKDSTRSEIKLKLFEELRKGLSVTTDAASDAGMYAFNAQSNIGAYRILVSHRQPNSPVKSRVRELIELHGKASNRVADLLTLLETHDIISEHFSLFRQALGCALGDANEIQSKMMPFLFRTWPIELPAGLHVPQASDADFDMMEKGCLAYWQAMTTISSYVYDIAIESQNVMLARIFNRRATARVPADPQMWVLRTNDKAYLVKLRKYFFEQHPVAAKYRSFSISAGAKAMASNTLASHRPDEFAPHMPQGPKATS